MQVMLRITQFLKSQVDLGKTELYTWTKDFYDELFKMRYEAREDMLRQEWDMQYYYTNQINEKDAELAKQASELANLLFVTLPASNYPKILQIKRRYSINYSDALSVRLFYPVPSVIIATLL